jgi:hypothetical protein
MNGFEVCAVKLGLVVVVVIVTKGDWPVVKGLSVV